MKLAAFRSEEAIFELHGTEDDKREFILVMKPFDEDDEDSGWVLTKEELSGIGTMIREVVWT